MLSAQELKDKLRNMNLIYVSDKRPGIMRQKIGKGFRFYDWRGKAIVNNATISRIKNLTIPPAWENVWICASAKGHLQATGYDEKGRKQYIYHEAWVKMCQEDKFNKMAFFGTVLPKIRRRVKKDLSLRGLPRKKVIATIVWLLEKTFIRVGNDEYARENHSFGLTTLRNKHARVEGDRVKLEFVGKSGVKHIVDFSNPIVAKIVKKCIELPGFELFQYIDEEGKKQVVDSADVNNYLKEITGEEITAKDFRTWGATLLSASTLHKLGHPENEIDLKKNIKEAVKKTAAYLRNTPSVCKNYYIHPSVFKSYLNNSLHKFFSKSTHQELAIIALLQAV